MAELKTKICDLLYIFDHIYLVVTFATGRDYLGSLRAEDPKENRKRGNESINEEKRANERILGDSDI